MISEHNSLLLFINGKTRKLRNIAPIPKIKKHKIVIAERICLIFCLPEY